MESPPKGSEEDQVRLEEGASVEVLGNIINSIADPIFVKDRQHRWVILNDAYCRFMGYPRERLIGKSDYDFFPKGEADVFWGKDEMVFQSGGENTNEESFTDGKGVTHLISTKKSIYQAADGKNYIVGVIRDMTESKKTDDALKLIGLRQKALLDNIPDIAWLKDGESRFIAVNEPFGRACGFKPQEIVGKTDLGIWPKDLAENYRKDDREVISSGKRKSVVEPLADKAGKVQWVETIKTPIFDEQGVVIGTAGIARDITESKRLKEDLEGQVKKRTTELSKLNARLEEDVLERERAEAMLHRKARMLEALYEIILSSHQVANLQQFLSSVLRSTVTFLDFDGGGIYLVNRELGSAQIITSINLPPEFLKEIRQVKIADKPYDTIFVHGVPIITDNLRQVDSQNSQKYGLFSLASIPIISRAQVVGALNIVSKKRHAISEDEKTVLLTICQELGIIIEKMRSEEALRESEQKYRLLSESSQDLIFMIGSDGRVQYVNAAGARQFRLSPQDIVGKMMNDLFPPDITERQSIRVQEVLESGKPLYTENLTKFNGREVWLDSWLIPVKGKDGTVVSVLGISRDLTERKKIEEELSKNEELFRSYFELSGVGSGLVGLDGNFQKVNPALSNLLGYSGDELTRMTFEEVTHKDDISLSKRVVRNLLHGKNQSITFQKRYISRRGDVIWALVNSSVVRDPRSGKALYFITQVQDITQHKKAELALMDSEEKYRHIVENTMDGIGIAQEGRLTYVNESFARMFGYRPKDLFGETFLKVVAPESRSLALKNARLRTLGKKVLNRYTFTGINKSGERLDIEIASSKAFVYQGKRTILAILKDVTAKKKAEDALKESEQKFKSLSENSPSGIFQTDIGGNTVYVNQALVNIIGLAKKECLGRGWQRYLHPADRPRLLKAISVSAKKNRRFELDFRVVRPGGGLRWLRVRSGPILGNHDKAAGRVGIITDITDRKMSEEALMDSEKKYRTLIDSLPPAVMIFQNSRITFANPSSLRIFGYGTQDELLGKGYLIHVPARERKRVVKEVRASLDGRRAPNHYTTFLVRKNGQEFPAEIYVKRITYIGAYAIQVIIFDITDRKRSEDAVRDSEERFRNIFEEGPLGMILSDPQTFRYIRVNGTFCKMLGYSEKELLKMSFKEITHPEHISADLENIRKLSEGKISAYQTEKRYLRKDGSVLWASTTVSCIRGQEGNVRYFIAMVEDITGRKLTEHNLEASEKRYRGLVESQKDLVVRVDNRGMFTFVNDAYCRAFGKRREQLLGRSFQPLVYEEDVRRTLDAMKGLDAPPYRIYVEQRAYTVNGLRWIGWEDYAIKDEKGGTVEIQAVGRDINDRKVAEMEIAEIKSHLEAILDGISESIVVLDKKYNIVSYNRAFLKWVGEPKDELKGMTCHRVIHGQDKSCRKCVIREVFNTRAPAESIHYHQTKKGRVFHETRAYPILHEGKIVEAIYVFRDVTDRERMKERLRENYEQLVKANEALLKLDKMKTEFLSIASHELRTPLAIIKGYADILASGALGSFNADQKGKIDRISSNVEHLNILVNNILDLTRMDAGELKLVKTRFSIRDLIEEVVNDMAQMASEKGVKLVADTYGRPFLLADRGRIKQLLVNLIDNSLKFTPERGRVTVSAREKGGAMTITVSDNGIGIKKREQGNIFKRFYQVDSTIQRKYKGSGLGLAICKRITELHGGSIKVRSVYSKGTRMLVTMPVK